MVVQVPPPQWEQSPPQPMLPLPVPFVADGNLNLFCSAVKIAKVNRAPGARIKIEIGSKDAGVILNPKMLPAPSNSRKEPIMVKATENPSPIPIPSNSDKPIEFFAAYASALPRIMQLTTISGI